MASNNNQAANDWTDLPQAKGDDWQDIPQKQPGIAADAADKVASGGKPMMDQPPGSGLMKYLKQGVGMLNAWDASNIKGATFGNWEPPQFAQEAMKEHPVIAGAGQAAGGIGAGGAIGELAAGGALAGEGITSALSRISANTGAGALQGYLRKPAEGDTRVGNAAFGGALGGGVSAVAEGASAAARPVADKLMKWATGIRKAPEGVGNTLVDQGLWGSKGMMLNQAESGLGREEQNLQDLVGQLKGNVDSQDIADAIAQHGRKFVSPNGITAPQVENDLHKIKDASAQFSSMGEGGELAPQDLLSLKRQGDWAGYTASGNPASATDSEIGRTVADKSRSLLSDMSGGETAATLKREQALIFAKKALEKDPTTHMGAGSSLIFGKLPGSAPMGSVGAQALQKSTDLARDPLLLQSLFGSANSR